MSTLKLFPAAFVATMLGSPEPTVTPFRIRIRPTIR